MIATLMVGVIRRIDVETVLSLGFVFQFFLVLSFLALIVRRLVRLGNDQPAVPLAAQNQAERVDSPDRARDDADSGLRSTRIDRDGRREPLTSAQGGDSMPSQFRGHCLDCGHEWDGIQWWIACGPVDVLKSESYRCYFCPRCFVDLCVPRRLTRSSWLRWITENASEMTRSPLLLGACELGVWIESQALQVISRSPLLFQACERVSGILAEHQIVIRAGFDRHWHHDLSGM